MSWKTDTIKKDGESRLVLEPEYGRKYWLGVHSEGSVHNYNGVDGFYVGFDGENHLFLNRVKDQVEIYKTSGNVCYLSLQPPRKEEPPILKVNTSYAGNVPNSQKHIELFVLERLEQKNNPTLDLRL